MKPGTIAGRPVRPDHRQGADEPRLPEPRPGRAGRPDRSRRVDPVGAVARTAGRSRCWPTTRCTTSAACRPLSADYFGAFAERIGSCSDADKDEPPFVGIMSNGTSGDINNVNFAGAAPGQARAVRADAASSPTASPGPPSTAYKKIEHRRLGAAGDGREGDRAGRAPARRGRPGPGQGDPRQGQGAGAEDACRRSTPARRCCWRSIPPTVKLQAAGASASASWASSPSRARRSSRSAWRSRRRARCKPTFTIELANGYNGYLPTPEQHELGGYETWRARSSYLEVDASPKITKTLLELLDKVK